ncbi:MAG: NUDIX hydrolase [bacterium]
MQKIGVTAFIYFEDKALLVRRSKNEKFLHGYYELPGGKIEFGESPEDALKREIKEEVNLEIDIIKPYSTFSYRSRDKKKHTIDIQFICNPKNGITDIKLSGEHDDFKWIKVDELKDYLITEQMREAILNGIKNN